MLLNHLVYASLVFLFDYSLGVELPISLDNRIVGGLQTDIKSYPYQLALEYLGQPHCGAALIAPKWAVTAAHCTDGSFTNFLAVRAGSTDLSSGGKLVWVKTKYQHSKYNRRSIDYDIALLELASPISSKYATPIALPAKDDVIRVGDNATITGWGLTSETGKRPSKKLQVVYVPVVGQSDCKRYYKYSEITNRMFCAGLPTGGKDSCQGDSGGPLVINGKLMGVVSWGIGCGRAELPGVYTNVRAMRDFIKNISGI